MSSQTEVAHATSFKFTPSERINYGAIRPYVDEDPDPVDGLPSSQEETKGLWSDFVADYLKYLELNVEAVSWYLISDDEQLKFYTRLERFNVGCYTLVVNLAVGTCIRSLNTCESEEDHNSNSGILGALLWSATFCMISSLYELIFLVPLFRYILQRDTDDSGIFQKLGKTFVS